MADWKRGMERTVRRLEEQLRGIRAGTVDRGFVETHRVDVSGRKAVVKALGTVVSQGDRIVVRAFDEGSVPAIVRALVQGGLSAYAMDRTTVAVSVPSLSGEQREQVIRQVKALGEEARVGVRQVRQESRKEIAAGGRHVPERAIQEATDAATKEIDRLLKAKIAELSA